MDVQKYFMTMAEKSRGNVTRTANELSWTPRTWGLEVHCVISQEHGFQSEFDPISYPN